jgi:hypothetical protein
MTTQVATGLVLLVLPLAYNGLFAMLGRAFDYPDILVPEPRTRSTSRSRH